MGTWLQGARAREALLVLGIVVLGATAHALNVHLDAVESEERATGDTGTLPDGNVVRIFSLGFDRLAADLFWVRTTYYMGDDASEKAGFPAAERLAQLVTDIDPYFQTVYVVMGSGLDGLVRKPEAALRLLEKGASKVRYWKVNFLLGFHYFFHRGDYRRAAEQLAIAAQHQDAPYYLPLLSSRLYAQAGDPATAMLMVRARLEQARNDEERATLSKRYADLWINRDLGLIDEAIGMYRDKHGRAPAKVADLVTAHLLATEPRDPRGGIYSIVDERATSAIPHEKLELKGQTTPDTRRPSVVDESGETRP